MRGIVSFLVVPHSSTTPGIVSLGRQRLCVSEPLDYFLLWVERKDPFRTPHRYRVSSPLTENTVVFKRSPLVYQIGTCPVPPSSSESENTEPLRTFNHLWVSERDPTLHTVSLFLVYLYSCKVTYGCPFYY